VAEHGTDITDQSAAQPTPYRRRLRRSGVETSALGLGLWQIGGATTRAGTPHGFRHAEEDHSLRGLQYALDHGVTFFDTADIYGCGQSERLLAQVLGSRRKDVVISTKFGHVFDEQTRDIAGIDGSAAYVRRACEDSLRRLETDYIDLYMLHINDFPVEQAAESLGALDRLVEEGKVRWHGWSTDDLERARLFADSPNCVAIQQELNVFSGDTDTLALCEAENLASINRRPLGLGLLTGRFNADSQLHEHDVRIIRNRWNFREGETAERLAGLDAIRDVLTSGGRTLAQGALCWIWGRSDCTIPIPGYTRYEQAVENVGALRFGPLSEPEMCQIDAVLGR
jgi:aryl-alcohol dehydrogenase-like predicted oxidoreductase